MTSSYKISGGKLVKIRLWIENGRIQRITILGDFFLHPEETILAIEKSLTGVELNMGSIENRIAKILNESKADLIGATPKDIANAIKLAWESS
ncbi:MAG: lipoate protein ligase C-terminal domain-containing protein [Promethearchaeota archaeon]